MFFLQSWFNSVLDWRLIVPTLGVVVALTTLIYAHWWRNRKRFSYEIVSDVELVSPDKVHDKIEIRFQGNPVDSVRLRVIKLINDGYQPLKKEDFEKPVRFSFHFGRNVLTAEKEKFQPENINTQITYGENWVEVAPTLFNRKDYIQFKVFLNGSPKMEIDARIVGVSSVEQVKRLPESMRPFVFWPLGVMVRSFFKFANHIWPDHEVRIPRYFYRDDFDWYL